MTHDEAETILEISRTIEEALSTVVKIDYRQVNNIVVADLLGKYKTAIRIGMSSEAKMLECVLTKYYLARGEFEVLVSRC